MQRPIVELIRHREIQHVYRTITLLTTWFRGRRITGSALAPRVVRPVHESIGTSQIRPPVKS